jgi:hypothetical protein
LLTRDINDPDDIRNWTWDRFRRELLKSSTYSPPNKKKLLDDFQEVKCKDPANSDQITVFDNAFMLQNLRLHRLDSSFSDSQQAQTYYNNLTPLVRRQMALRDPKRKDPEIHTNLDEVREEARDVSMWTFFQEEVATATSGRAMGALGVTGTTGAPPDKLDRRPKIKPQDGEVVKFSTGVTPQSKAWLESNATKYNCTGLLVVTSEAPLPYTSLLDLSVKSKIYLPIGKREMPVWSRESARDRDGLVLVTPGTLPFVMSLNRKRPICQRKQCKLLIHHRALKTRQGHIPLLQINRTPIPVLRNLVHPQIRQRCTRTMRTRCRVPMPSLVEGHVV